VNAVADPLPSLAIDLLDSPDQLTRFRSGQRSTLEAVYRAYAGEIGRIGRTGFVGTPTRGRIFGVQTSADQVGVHRPSRAGDRGPGHVERPLDRRLSHPPFHAEIHPPNTIRRPRTRRRRRGRLPGALVRGVESMSPRVGLVSAAAPRSWSRASTPR
jgi:hypothetical protein